MLFTVLSCLYPATDREKSHSPDRTYYITYPDKNKANCTQILNFYLIFTYRQGGIYV